MNYIRTSVELIKTDNGFFLKLPINLTDGPTRLKMRE